MIGKTAIRGVQINGSGEGAIDLHMAARLDIWVHVLCDPCDAWPTQTHYKSLSGIWRELKLRNRPCSSEAALELRKHGKATVTDGIVIERALSGFDVTWPKCREITPEIEAAIGIIFKKGTMFELSSVVALQWVLDFWGLKMSYDSVRNRIDTGRLVIGGIIEARSLYRLVSGRTSTKGKPSKYQTRIRAAVASAEAMAALE